jgi:hypothetical protein
MHGGTSIRSAYFAEHIGCYYGDGESVPGGVSDAELTKLLYLRVPRTSLQ